MSDENKINEQITKEMQNSREWLSEFENPESKLNWAKEPFERNAIFLGAVLNFLPNPFYVIDASDYTIKAANAAAQFGRLTKDSTCYALTHKTDEPCHSESHPCPLKKIKELKHPVTVEHIHIDSHGNPKNVEVHAFPIFDANGNLSSIIEYALDISDRKQAEEKLRISEERFMQIAEASEEWIWEVDIDGLFSYASPVVEKILGWKPSEIVGKKHFYDLFAPDSKEQLKKAAFEIFSKRKSFRRFTNVNAHRNGNHVILETSGLPILDKDENLLGYRGVDTDVTERIRAEEALKKAHDDLERRVEERTAELRKIYDERTFIRDTFGAYLSDEVATEILKSPEGVKLGGETREMTILVSDLREFSAITESMEASQIVQIINSYHEKMIPIVMRHEGTVDEFIGDGILAFFGAPRILPDHPRRAVACALEMHAAMEELNKENPVFGLPQIEMGIGISTGHLVVGSIGTDKRRKYGAVGSPINVAFRLEEKARPGEILITEGVKDKLGKTLKIGSHWNESLKGIGKTAIYRVIGMKKI